MRFERTAYVSKSYLLSTPIRVSRTMHAEAVLDSLVVGIPYTSRAEALQARGPGANTLRCMVRHSGSLQGLMG